MIIDRIRRLCEYRGVRFNPDISAGRMLDILDRRTGLDTTGGNKRPPHSLINGVCYQNPVGLRVRLHEQFEEKEWLKRLAFQNEQFEEKEWLKRLDSRDLDTQVSTNTQTFPVASEDRRYMYAGILADHPCCSCRCHGEKK